MKRAKVGRSLDHRQDATCVTRERIIERIVDAKRKAEEAEEDDDDYDEEPLKIHSGESVDLKLDSIESLDKKDSAPKLDFEVLI